ncbi:thioredoxin-like domain-containing protein [Lacipirellula limnantheis]|nr:thioredoxin-like domain-containing protein [Lacipirellula limnantheis]
MDVPGVSPQPLRDSALSRASAFALAIAVTLAVVPGCSKSATSAAGEDAAEIAGAEITDKMFAAYRDARSYTDHATYVQSYSYRGEGVERELPFFEMSLAYQQPNFIRLRFDEALRSDEGTARGFDIAANGTVMRASAVELPGQVLEAKAPTTITVENFLPDPLIREVFNNRAVGDVFPQLAMLLSDDDEAPVFPEDEAPRLLDQQLLGDRNCYRVATTSPKGKRIFWIDASSYVLRRMELPIEGDRRQFDPENQYANLAVWIDFKDPTFNAKIDEETFAKELGEGEQLVRRLIPAPPAAPSERLGETLVEFKFETPDGASVTNESLQGKTVLLDFWQVDCAPCKAHTPELEKVYQQLKDNDKFAFYAVSLDGKNRVSNDVAARTLKNWGGTFPLLRDPDVTAEKLQVAGTPTLMLLGPDGRLQYFHIRQHRDPQQLASMIQKVLDGADLAAEARAEHQLLLKKYESDLAAAAESGDLLQINVARPEFGVRALPEKVVVSELWQAAPEEIKAPGSFLISPADGDDSTAPPSILALDGGQAIVEFDLAGKLVARHEIPGNAAVANGFLRSAKNINGERLIAVGGVGWQKLHVFDHQWKPILAFPQDKNPGIADVQLAALTPEAEPMLYVGYWGGVGVQGVGLDGKRRWAIRSFDQVVQLTVAPADLSHAADAEPTAAAASSTTPRNLWGTSDRGTIFVLGPNGKPQPEIVVGLREIMHLAIRPEPLEGAARCAGLAVEAVGHYDVVGFDPDGEVRWQYELPAGEYAHQVERIQSVDLPGHGPAWMVAAPDGSIIWLGPDGQLIDQFRYAKPLTGLALTNMPDAAILLVSTPDSLTAWKLGEGTAKDGKSAKEEQQQ